MRFAVDEWIRSLFSPAHTYQGGTRVLALARAELSIARPQARPQVDHSLTQAPFDLKQERREIVFYRKESA